MFGQQDNNGAGMAPINDQPTPDPTPSISMPAPIDGPQIPSTDPLSQPTTIGQSAASMAGSMPSPQAGSSIPGTGDDLLDLKQQALQQLSPLVGQLEQSPEEKFRTTMMMIQASDNQDLIKDAFEAAKQITDDKDRAQALLDVINEINYFTQQQNQQ